MKPDSLFLYVAAQRARLPGFTLVELLVTIAVVAILASIATPSYRAFVAGQRIKTASFDIMSALTLARSEAIKRAAPVTVAPAGGAWTNGWSVTAPDGTILNQQSALSGLSITCKSGSPSSTVACPAGGLAYAGNGRLTAATAAEVPSFEIGSTSSTAVRCISIDLSGRPNSKVGACP
ncbi:GspH/FimT family pseudopilin [Ferrigenium kumadai]|uniref:GspH/FimT family pseudopilin n=1 Tax=Ferrigenium kumadai TaxID=1682490 RepID=UPI001BB30085|nr:GspH/FimT family pseudopilin [Ferrigenium kumadai]